MSLRAQTIDLALNRFAIGSVALLSVVSPTFADSPNWYAGASFGGNWASGADQRGWNRDSICYPTFACFEQNPAPTVDGYRWSYANDLDTGYAAELLLGRAMGRWRLELAFAQRENGLGQDRFLGLTHLDGSPVGQSTNAVASQAETGLGDFRARTVSLNAYFDFPGTFGKVTPYLGGGAGIAFLRVSKVFFADVYSDPASPPGAYDPPLSFYGSRQDDSFADTVAAGHLYAGLDYPLTERSRLGLKMAWTRLGALRDEGRYVSHPMHTTDPNFANHNRFGSTDHWSASLSWKVLFGR